jgi:hypothetical protein
LDCQYQETLVGGIPTPLKNMTSSVGMMKFPIYMESYKIPWFQTTNQKPIVDRIPMSVRSPDRKIADGFNRYELIGLIIPFVALKKTCHIKIEVS